MTMVETAELYAKEKHKHMTRKDGITPYHTHLASVVSLLKSLGITDEDILSSGWLHDTIEDTDTSFDDLYERFGQKVAILVSCLSKDEKLPKKDKERIYVKQLREAPIEAKLIKFCDISANLKDIQNSKMSKNKRKKTINKKIHYLKTIKNELIENKANYPKISNIIKGINNVLIENNHKPILFE